MHEDFSLGINQGALGCAQLQPLHADDTIAHHFYRRQLARIQASYSILR